MSGFASFKMTKTVEKKKVLKDSQIRDDSTKDSNEGTDFIKDISDNTITGTIVKKNVEELVIPLLVKNKWRDRDKATDDVTKVKDSSDAKPKSKDVTEKDKKELSIEEMAVKELVQESRKQLEDWREGDTGPDVDQVPLLLKNAAPAGYETEENLDVSLRAEQSTLDDYESIPVEKYGMAMLRGMGWKPGEGIGGFKKQVIAPLDPISRPKGLGLGATKPKKKEEVKEGEEKLELKRGAFVLIVSGKHADLYGEVEGLDEDNARVVVKLALGNEKLSVSENVIKLVTKTEYKEWAKIVNKDKFKKFKKNQQETNGDNGGRSPSDDAMVDDDHSNGRPSKKKSKQRDRDRDRSRDRSDSPEVKRMKVNKPTWVRRDLKVRCIDKKFKGGRYYNEKLVVFDVVTSNSCDCRTEEGKIVEGLSTDHLETVIPRQIGDRVQIVKGNNKGEIAELLGKDKSRCEATIRLLETQEVLRKDYEHICMYVGRMDEFD